MALIYVVGHRNPDNDAIMSAYTFAALKNQMDPENEYKPVRLGPLPAESKMLFERYGLEAPELIESVGEGDKVILTDHNEMSQAVPGIENAEVVEVIDHHRIADVSTASPIPFINLPLGSTCTIIKKIYNYHGIEISEAIAACLLSAMLTDTVILKSPTATDEDAKIIEELAEQVGVDYTEFGMSLFKSRAGDSAPAADICKRDSKEFNFNGTKAWIAQHETVDLEGMKDRIPEIQAEVDRIQQEGGYDVALMLLTDILVEGSEFLGAGNLAFLEDAFGISFAEGTVWMPGVLSRKKQVASKLIEYAG